MRLRTKAVMSLALVLCLALLSVSAATAQTVTTGNIAGTVTDAQGGVLPGATVTAVHTPTGTSYEAVTGTDGRYSILNVRVGPYTINVTMGQNSIFQCGWVCRISSSSGASASSG